ncbi:MAG: hypothetical protein C4575_13650 [Desulforudis sp.]|nr:MAG: hypothetical protein C4575_13650 [Desulforudis sp.]
MDVLLLIAAAGAAAYLLWPKNKAETAQDLISFREIHPDGIIELPDYRFRLVMEVEPVNLALKSAEEQAAIWIGLRSLANSLHLPHTWLVQTRYLDLKDYLDRYRKMGARYGEHIGGYVGRLADWLESESEGKQQRSRRVFLIIKVDAAAAGIESGIRTDNPLVNSAIRALGGVSRARLSPDDMRRLARDELYEAASVVRGVLAGLEIRSRVLGRAGALEMLYQTFNRDLAAVARVSDADQDEVFSLFVRSETPELAERSLEKNAVA